MEHNDSPVIFATKEQLEVVAAAREAVLDYTERNPNLSLFIAPAMRRIIEAVQALEAHMGQTERR